MRKPSQSLVFDTFPSWVPGGKMTEVPGNTHEVKVASSAFKIGQHLEDSRVFFQFTSDLAAQCLGLVPY